MANNFHIESRLRNEKDIVRTFDWEILIPDIGSVTTSIKDMEDLVVRARSVNLPSRGNETIESYFQGMKQKFLGQKIGKPFWPARAFLLDPFSKPVRTAGRSSSIRIFK